MPTRKPPRTATSRRKQSGVRRRPAAPVPADSAAQIWAAGLGALSRARTEGPAGFINLVREGVAATGRTGVATQKAMRGALAAVQDAIGARVSDARTQANVTLDGLEKLIHTRVHRALHQLGVPTVDEVTVLTRKVEELNRSVIRLLERRPSRSAGRNAAGRRRRAAG